VESLSKSTTNGGALMSSVQLLLKYVMAVY